MKYFLFILLSLVACQGAEIKSTEQKPPKDTIYTHIEFAYNIGSAKAKILIKDTVLEVWEPRKDDTSVSDRVRKKFYDTLYFVNIVDSAADVAGIKRKIDTFLFIPDKLVIKDLRQNW